MYLCEDEGIQYMGIGLWGGLPFSISCPTIFPELSALSFHLFGSNAAKTIKEVSD